MNRTGVFGGPTVLGIGALDETGTKYIVEKGDYPARIATKLVGSSTRWKELVAANPQKSKSADGNFKFLNAGESLNLPASWQKAAPETTQPAQPIIGTTVPSGGGGGSSVVVPGSGGAMTIIPVGGGAPSNQAKQWVKGVPNVAVIGGAAVALAGVAFFAMKK